LLLLLNILPHIKCVATLLCKILRSKVGNLKHILWLMINHKLV